MKKPAYKQRFGSAQLGKIVRLNSLTPPCSESVVTRAKTYVNEELVFNNIDIHFY